MSEERTKQQKIQGLTKALEKQLEGCQRNVIESRYLIGGSVAVTGALITLRDSFLSNSVTGDWMLLPALFFVGSTVCACVSYLRHLGSETRLRDMISLYYVDEFSDANALGPGEKRMREGAEKFRGISIMLIGVGTIIAFLLTLLSSFR